jgi:signal transduction histidine kinase
MIRYWGKDRNVIGRTFKEILPELENQPFPQLLEAVYTTGETYTGREEKADIIVDGKLQSSYFNFTYKALRNVAGEIYGIYHAAIDVTEQVMARKKAEESGQQVRSLIESASFPIGVFTGKEMRITLANKAITDTWAKGSDVIGKLYTDILPELENQAIFDQLNNVFTTGNALHVRNQRVDIETGGKLQPFYFNYSLMPLYDAEGKVYGIMNTAADVTDLNLAKQKVEQSERNFKNMILQAPVAMCILMGPTHIVEVANEMMIELWGKPVHEVMHKPIFDGLPDARHQGLENLMDNVFNTGDTFKAYEWPVTLFRNGRFETVYQNFVYEAYKDSDGTILGVLAIAIDITHQVLARRKIEEIVGERTSELAEANSKLQKSNAELAQFAYIASHDLQEPVRKVTTFANMLEHSLGEIDERSNRYLDKIKESSTRMNTLIKDVLTYSQLSKDKEVFEMVDLAQIVENIKTDFELLIEQKEAIIEFTELPIIEAIPLQMAQLFGNLISNSLKFSRPYVQPVITISAQQIMHANNSGSGANTGYYNIEVRDNGIGFHPKYAQQVFNIFQRLHGRQEYAGTGIGLAMCKKIAQNHHGDIYAGASTESGAVFNIMLPAKQTKL